MAPRRTRSEYPHTILMTADTVGGVWTFATDLCEGLALSGVDVILATLGGLPSPAQLRSIERIPGLRLHSSDFKLEWMENPWRDVDASSKWILELADRYSPDVVHLNSYAHASLSWDVPVILTAHSCVASWWSAVRTGPLPENWDGYISLVENALNSADLVTAPSQAMVQMLAKYYRFSADSSRVRVIPNGRPAAKFYQRPKEKFVFSSGRLWDAGKGISTLVEIARDLPWPVYLAGEYPDAEKEHLAASGCRMLGRLSSAQMAEYYSCAPIYVLPAHYEPFGLSALEAALSGCALILGDIASLREVWRDNAIFVRPGDPGALAHAICQLIHDPAQRKVLASRAEQRAHEFDGLRMTHAYLKTYALARKEQCTCVA